MERFIKHQKLIQMSLLHANLLNRIELMIYVHLFTIKEIYYHDKKVAQ